MKKFLSAAFATTAFAAALFVGPNGTFTAANANTVNIYCSDGSSPTCSPIYNSGGKVVGYSCSCA